MKTRIQLICFCCIIFPIALFASNKGPSIKEALELAANQQVLSQRISKIYLALCHNTRDPKLYQERAEAVEAFEEQLYRMSLLVPNERVKENIQEVRSLWKTYKAVADWTIKNEAVDKLLRQASNLLKATKLLHAAYQEYEYTIKENSDLITVNQYINQNYNQRVIIERIMTYYLASKQSVDDLTYSFKLEEAKKAFTRILFILEKAETTSQNIQTELQTIRSEWELMREELESEGNDLNNLSQMLEHSKAISLAIQEMIYNYEALGAKLSLSYAINQATAQCVLVQKIAKSYVASMNEKVAYTYQKELLKCVDKFEQTQRVMLMTVPTEETRGAIHVVKTMWKNYKQMVTNFELRDPLQTIKVLEQSYVVMAACDRAVEAVENYAQTIPAYRNFSIQNGQAVDKSMDITQQIQLASKLRIYTQRVALYFMMKTNRIDQELSNQRLQVCIHDFIIQLNALKKSELNNSFISQLIEDCSAEWELMATICANNESKEINKMLLSSRKLSNKLTALADLYEHYMNELFAQDMEYSN
ncbi:hypothetical protein [Aureispira anguillae]|uniref:Uncharacterized protein n=1 Tax=Aureispira anguillae TaxID=2864201 RepID=A0A915YFH3_9BACT|nr:hypothetical protein [Aureispira anguillae]BDS12163.1 hypothetical protein AsAng_0028780 [Aureispira anguillae]